MKQNSILQKIFQNRNWMAIACAVLIAVSIIVVIMSSLPRAMSHEADGKFVFTGTVDDPAYSAALYNETISFNIDGINEVESIEAFDALNRVSVRVEAMVDAVPGTDVSALSPFTLSLIGPAGNEIAAASPEISQITSATGDAVTVISFSFALDVNQFEEWRSYRLDTHGLEGVCSMPEPDTHSMVVAAKDSFSKTRDENRAAVEQRIKEKEEAEKKAREEARAAEEAAIRSGNIPTRSSYDGNYSDVLMIGDSIMVLTSFSVEPALPGVTIDASSGRSLETGGPNEGYSSADGVLDHVRNCDRSFERYIIGTGNNDGFGMSVEDAEEIIACLDGKQVWFVTEYVSNNSAGTANTNAAIDDVCSRYSNVHKIDWYSLVSNHPEWLQGDNCHPQTSDGREAYATIVKNALDA